MPMPIQAAFLPVLFVSFVALLLQETYGQEMGKSETEHTNFDASGCGLTKGCLMKPSNCTPHKDCAYAFSYVADEKRVYFELLGQVDFAKDAAFGNRFVALGFSIDGLMGGDTVTDCSSFQGEPFSGRLSYNPGKSNRKVPLDAETEKQILRTHTARFADGTVYCRFSQLIQPPAPVQSQFVRILSTPIFILMSAGTTQNRELNIHTLNADSPHFPFSSATPIALTQFQLAPESSWLKEFDEIRSDDSSSSSAAPPSTTDESSSSTSISSGGGTSPCAKAAADTDHDDHDEEGEDHFHVQDFSTSMDGLTKAHGVLMLFAWLLFAPFGILCGRFLRNESVRLCGLQIWFQVSLLPFIQPLWIHRLSNLLAVLCVSIAFCCILSANSGTWTGPRPSFPLDQNLLPTSLHALFGILAIALTFCQPLIALLRCSPDSAHRCFFSLVHCNFGYIAWIFAAISASIACFSAHFGHRLANSALARDLMIGALALMFVTLLVLQWIAFRPAPPPPNPPSPAASTTTTKRGAKGDDAGGGDGGAAAIVQFAVNGTVLSHLDNDATAATAAAAAAREREVIPVSRLIQRAILGLFLILAFALALTIAFLVILA